jgi:hypothetical protein
VDALLATDAVSNNVLCPPMYSHMETTTVSRICECIKRIYLNANEIREELEQKQIEPPTAREPALVAHGDAVAERRA